MTHTIRMYASHLVTFVHIRSFTIFSFYLHFYMPFDLYRCKKFFSAVFAFEISFKRFFYQNIFSHSFLRWFQFLWICRLCASLALKQQQKKFLTQFRVQAAFFLLTFFMCLRFVISEKQKKNEKAYHFFFIEIKYQLCSFGEKWSICVK